MHLSCTSLFTTMSNCSMFRMKKSYGLIPFFPSKILVTRLPLFAVLNVVLSLFWLQRRIFNLKFARNHNYANNPIF